MKIRSSVSFGLFVGAICLVVLMLAAYVFWAITQIWWPAILLTILVIVVCLVYFNTFYELLPEGIMLSCGFVAKAVPYKSIVSMTDEDTSVPSFCLSSKRVLIKYMEDDQMKYTYASPANREQFRELVNKEINQFTQKIKSDAKDGRPSALAQERTARQVRSVKVGVIENNRLKSKDDELVIVKGEAKPEFDKKYDTLFDKSGKKVAKESKLKEAEEKKLLAKLRKEKRKETKLAAKQEKENMTRQQKAMMAQTKRNEKAREEKLKSQVKEQKQKDAENKLEKQQKRFAAKETVKAEKIQEKKQAKATAKENKKNAADQKERKAAQKQVKQLKEKDAKATERKLKQEKKDN